MNMTHRLQRIIRTAIHNSTSPFLPQHQFRSPVFNINFLSHSRAQQRTIVSYLRRRTLRLNVDHLARTFLYTTGLCSAVTLLLWFSAHELLEHDFPSPHEWDYRSRLAWHSAHAMRDPVASTQGVTQWGVVAIAWDWLLQRLESSLPESGRLSSLAHERHTCVQLDLSRVMDISNMPEPWRRGYVEALMGAAEASENLSGMWKDSTTHMVWSEQYVKSLENPNPNPINGLPNPTMENCIPFTPTPEQYYEKILATRGLEDYQFVAASLAYSNYLTNVGAFADAEIQIHAALLRSMTAIPNSIGVLDTKTSSLHVDGNVATPNLLNALTAMAVHKALTGKPQEALPIILSVVRAYRSVSSTQPPKYHLPFDPLDTGNQTFIQVFSARAKEFLTQVAYPPAPPTGNDPLAQSPSTTLTTCAEAKAVAYAAEVLFGTSKSQQSLAMHWTRESAATAIDRALDPKLEWNERDACARCVGGAMENWGRMLVVLAAVEAAEGKRSWWRRAKVGTAQEEQEKYLQMLGKVEGLGLAGGINDERAKLWKYFPERILSDMY